MVRRRNKQPLGALHYRRALIRPRAVLMHGALS
jgi:hypothetical protein